MMLMITTIFMMDGDYGQEWEYALTITDMDEVSSSWPYKYPPTLTRVTQRFRFCRVA